MGCLKVILGVFVVRLALIFVFVLTDAFGRAYETRIWPVLGFIFAPYSTLSYMIIMLKNNHVVSGPWMVLMVLAIILDLTQGIHLKFTVKRS